MDKEIYGALGYEELIADLIKVVQRHEQILQKFAKGGRKMITEFYMLDMTPANTFPIVINVSQRDDIKEGLLAFSDPNSAGSWVCRKMRLLH